VEETIEVRKISRKTYIYMAIIALLGIVIFYLSEQGKSGKAQKILAELGYKNTTHVEVYSVTQFENVDTKIQGYKYFVTFNDIDTNQECKGFIAKDFKHNVIKDLTCKQK